MLYVIDAGVVVKWFIPEADSDIARQLLDRYRQGLDSPIAPDLLISECANVFWRRCRKYSRSCRICSNASRLMSFGRLFAMKRSAIL